MSEISLKDVCCTCLSTNRSLHQLCRVADGVNLLYMLLMYYPDAYKEGFYKETASLRVCWECSAVLHRIKRFQLQACAVQKQLTAIIDGQDVKLKSLSRLRTVKITKLNHEYQYDHETGILIDCSIKGITDIKVESDDDDIPLSLFYNGNHSNDDYTDTENNYEDNNLTDVDEKNNKAIDKLSNTDHENDFEDTGNTKSDKKKKTAIDNFHHGNTNINVDDTGNKYEVINRKTRRINSKHVNTDIEKANFENTNMVKKKTDEVKFKKEKDEVNPSSNFKYKKYFTINLMNEEEMKNYFKAQRKRLSEPNILWKCVTCVREFKSVKQMVHHNNKFHKEKENCTQCEICLSYVDDIQTHTHTHFYTYRCALCVHNTYTHIEIVTHLYQCHNIVRKRKKTYQPKFGTITDDLKYPCPKCDKSFRNKDIRWRHIQKTHHEGYKCKICEKKFTLKGNLERHERIHKGTIPREECQICHKMVRKELAHIHKRTHTRTDSYICLECDKTFVSRTTYENHLKYSQAHALGDNFKLKCELCNKGYLKKCDLEDHINYHHKGLAKHKCPICGKGLATKRCLKRHVRRAHEGYKENVKDYICQQCGKSFKIKKCLLEHELIHTGAKPLSCSICGRAFRQKAALYTHNRRVHKGT